MLHQYRQLPTLFYAVASHFSCPIFNQAKTRMKSTAGCKSCLMAEEALLSFKRKQATVRYRLVSGFLTEVLEVESEEPFLNVLFIPGNPGIVSFYKDFAESLYEQLEGTVSITAIGHSSHSKKDSAFGRLFSLQEQINHKVDFIKGELQNKHLPILLVGHSIGSYICMDIMKEFPEQVIFSIFLYPFLAINTSSSKQYMIGVLSRSSLLSATISYCGALIGLFPTPISRALGRLAYPSWSATAVDATCSFMAHHALRNALFMAKTEFEEITEEPDWRFIEENKEKIAFLFGDDDHWAPLSLFEEISRRVPDVELALERVGHTHSFCCTESGSVWVARHVAGLIRNQVEVTNRGRE